MAKQKYWYMRFISECPVCGRTRITQERRYTPKPEDPNKRVEYDPMDYDYCDVL